MTALLVAVVAFTLASAVSQPVNFPDETGALMNARWMAGLGPRSTWWFLPGYGVLFAPLVALTNNVAALTAGIHATNAALLGATALGLWKTSELLWPAAPARQRALAVVVCCCYPAHLYFVVFAIADNLILALVAWIGPFVSRLCSRKITPSAAVATVVGGAAAAVHARMAATVLAVAVALWLHGRRGQSRGLLPALLLATGAVFSALARLALDTSQPAASTGTGRQAVGDLLGDNLSVRALLHLPINAVSQGVYLTAATAGLFAVGVVELRQIRSRAEQSRSQRAVVDSVGLVFAANAAISLLFTNRGIGDFAIFGRYVEVAAPVLLLAGLHRAIDRRVGTRLAALIVVGLPMGALGVVLARGAETFDGRLQRLNVSGAAIAIALVDRLDPIAIGLVGSALATTVFALARWRGQAAAGVGLAFLAAAILDVNAARTFARDRGGEPSFVATVAQLSDPGTTPCVALDQTDLTDFWDQENFRLHRLDWELPNWSKGVGSPPCPDFIVSSRPNLGEVAVGWRAVEVLPGTATWLWVSPAILASRDPSAIEGPDLSARVDATGINLMLTTLRVSNGQASVSIQVTNMTGHHLIPAIHLPDGRGAVQIGLEWREPDNNAQRLHEPVRLALPNLLAPGETVTIDGVLPVTITAEDGTLAIDSTSRLLRAEVVQESIGWLPETGVTTPVELAS